MIEILSLHPKIEILNDVETHTTGDLFRLGARGINKINSNASNLMSYYQVKSLLAAKYFSSEDASQVWHKILSIEDFGDYIHKHYTAYWNKEDCIILDKFYAFADRINDGRIKALIFALMIEVMKHQNIYGRFNRIGAPDEIEQLTEAQFQKIVNIYIRKLQAIKTRAKAFIEPIKEFISNAPGGIISISIPARNIFLDYHAIIDVLENYNKGVFKPHTYISKQLQKKIDSCANKGDRFIKKWASRIPLLEKSAAEYIVFNLPPKLSLEREWLVQKFKGLGDVAVKNNLIIINRS